jgi:hypothetical protein
MRRKLFWSLLLGCLVGLCAAGTASAATISVNEVVSYDPNVRDSFPLGQITLVEDADNLDEFNQQHILIELPAGAIWDQDRIKVRMSTMGSASRDFELTGRDITFPTSEKLRVYISQNSATREIITIQGNIIVQGGRNRDDVKATIDVSIRDVKGLDGDQLLLAAETVPDQRPRGITARSSTVSTVYPDEYDQALGSVKITEVEVGSLREGDVLRFSFPAGVKTGGITGGFPVQAKVLSGNLVLGGFSKASDGSVSVSVRQESTSPAEVEIQFQRFDIADSVSGEINVYVEWGDQGWRVLTGRIGSRPVPVTQVSTFTIGSTSFFYGSRQIHVETAPYIKQDRVYLPVRYAAMAVGIDDNNVIWNPDTAVVTLKGGGNILTMTIGKTTATLNGQPLILDVPPEIVGGRTMLPCRAVVEAFNYHIYWLPDKRQITIRDY